MVLKSRYILLMLSKYQPNKPVFFSICLSIQFQCLYLSMFLHVLYWFSLSALFSIILPCYFLTFFLFFFLTISASIFNIPFLSLTYTFLIYLFNIFQLRPKWHAYSSLKVRDTYNTLNYDSLKSTKSIQGEVSTNAQIEQIFDNLIYQKGSSILKMLNSTLSQEVFKKGLQHFVKKQ